MSLTVKERIQALADGKKIRRTFWDSNAYTDGVLYYQEDDFYRIPPSELGYTFEPATEWELYKEPKLEITAKDIGRVAVFSDGIEGLILSFNPKHTLPVGLKERRRGIDGTAIGCDPIIRIRDVGEDK